MYACMTPVGFDTSDKFENHWTRRIATALVWTCDANFSERNSQNSGVFYTNWSKTYRGRFKT